MKTNHATKPSTVTFEHELARSSIMLPFMLKAFEELHPRITSQLRTDLNSLTSDDEKADHFLKEFLRVNTSKGLFAQELAILLSSSSLDRLAVPKYIQSAFVFLGVIS